MCSLRPGPVPPAPPALSASLQRGHRCANHADLSASLPTYLLNAAMQRQNVVSAHFKSEQILAFAFAEHNGFSINAKQDFPANTRRWSNDGFAKPSLLQRLVLAGKACYALSEQKPEALQHWVSVSCFPGISIWIPARIVPAASCLSLLRSRDGTMLLCVPFVRQVISATVSDATLSACYLMRGYLLKTQKDKLSEATSNGNRFEKNCYLNIFEWKVLDHSQSCLCLYLWSKFSLLCKPRGAFWVYSYWTVDYLLLYIFF